MMNTKSFLVDLKIFFQIVTYRSNLEVGKLQKKYAPYGSTNFLTQAQACRERKGAAISVLVLIPQLPIYHYKKAVTLLGVTAKILLRINVPSWLLVKEALMFQSSCSFLCLRRSDNSELLFQAGKVVERGSGVADFPSAELLCSD